MVGICFKVSEISVRPQALFEPSHFDVLMRFVVTFTEKTPKTPDAEG
jgi:hypothetical protein